MQPPSGPPEPPDQVPFPTGEAVRVLPPGPDAGKLPRRTNGRFAKQAESLKANGRPQQEFVPVFAKTANGQPLNDDQASALADHINEQRFQEEVDHQLNGNFADPSDTARGSPSEIAETQERLRLIGQAGASGMVLFADHVVGLLGEFQQRFFQQHGQILSINQSWAMLVNTVNLALPNE